MSNRPLDFSIRDARIGDAPALARFNQMLAEETEGKRLDDTTILNGVTEGIRRTDRCRYFVAEVENQVIGQAMFTYEWSDWRNGELWWLQSVFVHPDFRRRGVFTALYRHIESLAKENDAVRGLRLYVEEENSTGQAVYAHLGMQHAGYHVYEVEF